MINRIKASTEGTISSAHSPETAEGWFTHPEMQLRAALTLAIKSSPYSRDEIADRMTTLLRRRITVHIVNSWCSETKERVRFPACWIPIFCKAAMDDGPQLALLSPEHRTRLEIKKDLEVLRRAITALLVAERKKARAKNKGAGRPSRAKKAKGKKR